MDKKLNTALNNSKWIVRITLFTMAIIVLGHRFLQNGLRTIWLDESIMVFIANHTPFTPPFFEAVKENIAGMPWPFIEYWAWLQALRLVPIEHLTAHVEYYLRFPLTIYSLIMFLGSYLMVKRMAKSRALALFVSTLLFLGNDLSAHLGGELRFHSSGMAHMILSWCALSYLVTAKDETTKRRKWLFTIWIISSIISGWTHLYASFSFLLQIAFFIGVNMDWIPKTHPPVKKITGIFTQFILFIIFNLQIAYFRFFTIQPYSRAVGESTFTEIFPNIIRLIDHRIFIPWVWFWLMMIIVFTIQNFIRVKREDFKQSIALFVLILAAFTQILIIGGLGYYYLKWNWGPEAWFARYVMAGVVPFVFLLSYFARDFIPEIYDKLFSIIISGVMIFIFIFNPAFGKSYWGNQNTLNGTKRWIELRELIKDNNAYGKVTAIIGAKPHGRALDQEDYFGAILGFPWQIYTNGPHSINSIKIYYKDNFAGRTGIPCAIRHLYPPANKSASEFAVDFCEEGKVTLRIFRP